MAKNDNNGYYVLIVPYATTSFEGIFDVNAIVYTDDAHAKQPAQTTIYLPKISSERNASKEFFSKGVPVTISISNRMELISGNRTFLFEDAPLPEKYAIVFHELYHVVITYNPYLFNTRIAISKMLDTLTNNLLHDFIIDTIGATLQDENMMVKMALQSTKIDEYHYFNYLKNWEGFIGDLARFLYGSILESKEYQFPQIPSMPIQSYEDFVKAWTELRNGIKELRDSIIAQEDDYFNFWRSGRMFSVDNPTKVMRELRDILDNFADALEKISRDLPRKNGTVEDMLEECNSDVSKIGINNKDFQATSEIVFSDEKGNSKSEKYGSNALKDYLNEIKQVTATPKNRTGDLVSAQCPSAIRSYAKKIAYQLINNTRLKNYVEQSNVYNHRIIFAKERDFSEGEANIDRIVENYAVIKSGKGDTVPLYDSYHMKSLPRMSIMVVTDVSASMNKLNATLKPFLSTFYLEGLQTLFDINIVDFSESVIKEPKLKGDTSVYYCKIGGEGGTDPFTVSNLPVWKKIIKDIRPEIVLFYSDFNYSYLDFYTNSTEAKNITIDMFRKFGIDQNRVFLFDVEEIANKSVGPVWYDSADLYKKFLNVIATRTMEAIMSYFNRSRRIETTR